MKIRFSPSLLACDFLHLEDEVKRAEASGADMLHCDVMDGVYVPNISFGFDIIKKIHTVTSLPLDVHMMTSVPEMYIYVLKEAGASSVTLHSDVMPEKKLKETFDKIRDAGMKTALSLRPGCPAEDAFPFIDYIDMVLVMTVEPGFGGQKFMHDMMPKVRTIRDYLNIHKPEVSIQVDGGVASSTIEQCAEAGADNFVVGTASFRAPDMKQALSDLKTQAVRMYRG